jgi:type IV secretion system protein VirB10
VSEPNSNPIPDSQAHGLGGTKKKKTPLLHVLLGVVVVTLVGAVVSLKVMKSYEGEGAEDTASTSTAALDMGAGKEKARTNVGTGAVLPPPPDKEVVEETKVAPTGFDGEEEVEVGGGFKKYLSIPLIAANGTKKAPLAQQAAAPAEPAQTKETKAGGGKGAKVEVEPTTAMVASAIDLDPNLYVEENTTIPCSLQTRFVSDVAGRISCVISEDVYSANGNVKLIEKGTKAFGVYQSGTLRQGQGRLFVAWEQLRTPDFKRINLVDTAAAGELGEAGIDGWVDTHFWERFGGALMLSLVQDVVAVAADTAPSKDRNVDYTENSRTAMAEMAKVALENSINIPPTLYKNQGDIISILVGRDIDFSSLYTLKERP